jgi:3-oxoacyl-[acyl-carrier-protein] synthase-3
MFAKIARLDYYLPATILSNELLEKDFPDWPAAKIEEKTGIRQRHVAAAGETALDLGLQAAEKVLAGYDRSKIDFVLFCTQSPDYFLPTGACLLQAQLGLKTNAGALDFNLGCSGYVYGLALAQGLIAAGTAATVLFITAETYSKFIHPTDRGNRSIFGDGASATILEASAEPGLREFVLGTDGAGAKNLMVKNGGQRHPATGDVNGAPNPDDWLYMNGPEIFNFTIKAVPALVQAVLEKNRAAWDQIDYVIFHQANKFMLDHLARKIGIPREKFHCDLAEEGNTVSSTIPLALKKCLETGKVAPGQTLLLAGFGVGYSWGAVLVKI